MSADAAPIFVGRFPAKIDHERRVQVPTDALVEVVAERDGRDIFCCAFQDLPTFCVW